MVDTLGASVFPYLPKALEQLLAESEEIRELQELQRTLYTFLHVIATHDLSSVFLSPRSRGYLDPMMQLLLHTACGHKDTLLVLFGEIVVAQKVMYEKFGNEFLIHFVSKGFPAAHCPQDLAEEYCQKLQVSEIAVA